MNACAAVEKNVYCISYLMLLHLQIYYNFRAVSYTHLDVYKRQVPIKYFKWIRDVFRGDFGYSIKYKKPVWDVICERLPNTVLMGAGALILSTAIAIPAGKTSATKRNSVFDYMGTVLSFIGISIPAFFFGLLLIKWLSFDLKIFPISGMVTVCLLYTSQPLAGG